MFFDLNPAKQNVMLLALAQALAMTVNPILLTTAALIGCALVEDKALTALWLSQRHPPSSALIR